MFGKGQHFYSILPLRCPRQRHLHRIEHIFNENAVPRGGIVDEDVRHSPHQFAVLDDGGVGHECDQVGTTVFNEKFKT